MANSRRRRTWGAAAALILGAIALGGLAGRGGSWVALVAVALAAAGIVLTRSPYVGLLGVIFFLPLERIGAYESSIGTIRISQVIALVTLVIWGLRVLLRPVPSEASTRPAAHNNLTRPHRARRRPNPVVYPLAAFLAIGVLGLSRSPNLSYSVVTLLLTAFTIGVGMLVPQLITTRRQLTAAVKVLLVSAVLVSLFGLFQFLGDMAGLPPTVTGLRDLYTKEVFGFPRVQSTAHEPLYFANYLLLPLGLVYALILAKRSPVPPWILFGAFAIVAVNLVLTVSRGGYLGAGALLLLMTVLAIRDVIKPRVLVPLAIGALVAGAIVLQALRFDDATGLNLETYTAHIQNVFFGASYNERVETFEQAKAALWLSPLIGIGPGSFGPLVAQTPFTKPVDGWRIVNNESLELLTEYGVLGALAMLVAIVMLLLRTIKALARDRDPTSRYLLLGLLGSCIGILVQYQTFSTLYIMHVWVAVGLLIAAQQIALTNEML
ncbi:MAG: O-antigen ligase family protein [Candidatus Kerfeldbacteria bacterium]|nr:O-antigen ligase family protein [Candidatus Kerfeldbacteria bacterium]